MGDKYYPRKEMSMTGEWTGRWVVAYVDGISFGDYNDARNLAWLMNWAEKERNKGEPC